MLKISVEEASDNLKGLLEHVAQGEEVILTENNQAVARLVPLQEKRQRLANIKKFRDSIQFKGEPLSDTVINARQG